MVLPDFDRAVEVDDIVTSQVKEVILKTCGPIDTNPEITESSWLTDDMTLVGDLKAWCIDFLDLEFQLQKKFGIAKLATEREHVRLRDDRNLRALITVGMIVNRVKERVALRGV